MKISMERTQRNTVKVIVVTFSMDTFLLYSFPSTEFELWVSNLDGRPAKIVVIGEYLAPKEVSWPTPEKYKNCQHAIIDKKEVNAERNE